MQNVRPEPTVALLPPSRLLSEKSPEQAACAPSTPARSEAFQIETDPIVKNVNVPFAPSEGVPFTLDSTCKITEWHVTKPDELVRYETLFLRAVSVSTFGGHKHSVTVTSPEQLEKIVAVVDPRQAFIECRVSNVLLVHTQLAVDLSERAVKILQNRHDAERQESLERAASVSSFASSDPPSSDICTQSAPPSVISTPAPTPTPSKPREETIFHNKHGSMKIFSIRIPLDGNPPFTIDPDRSGKIIKWHSESKPKVFAPYPDLYLRCIIIHPSGRNVPITEQDQLTTIFRLLDPKKKSIHCSFSVTPRSANLQSAVGAKSVAGVNWLVNELKQPTHAPFDTPERRGSKRSLDDDGPASKRYRGTPPSFQRSPYAKLAKRERVTFELPKIIEEHRDYIILYKPCGWITQTNKFRSEDDILPLDHLEDLSDSDHRRMPRVDLQHWISNQKDLLRKLKKILNHTTNIFL